MILNRRSSGIILHPTSLPGPDGIGDFGPQAYQWINTLAKTGCALWQILPLGPTGYGDSPYQSFSAFAGNPYLISPALLLDDGIIDFNDLSDRPVFEPDQVDYGQAIPWKLTILDRAVRNFSKKAPKKLRSEYDLFFQQNTGWLQDFSAFMAIKEAHGGVSWGDWPNPLRKRDPIALSDFRRNNPERIECHALRQFFFFRQWKALKNYSNENFISIIGDIPIFVAYDSADVWANPNLFFLNENLDPEVVAGVPPDYFSPTGQLWGNPIYNWGNHKNDNYDWWKKRITSALSMVDIVRLDHFRGFAGYWEIKAGMPTAAKGRWVKGPGEEFFSEIFHSLGKIPIIAEDLGEITTDVIKLREKLGFPGMKILQFAFASNPRDNFLPHNYPTHCVAYTGTHDNDTACGWYDNASEKERDFYRRYLARPGTDIAWDLIRSVWGSVAQFALAPLQDFLSLGTEARMNFPSKLGGNWNWRMKTDSLSEDLIARISDLNLIFDRSTTSKDDVNKSKQIKYNAV